MLINVPVLFILISRFILSLFLSYIVWRVFQCPNFVYILFIMKGQIINSIMKTFTCVEIHMSGGLLGTGGRTTGLQGGARSGSHGGSGDSGGHGWTEDSGGHGGSGDSGGHGWTEDSGGHGGSGDSGGHGGTGDSKTAAPAPASVSTAGALLPPQKNFLGKVGARSGT